MRVVVPFDAVEPKTRLSPVLTPDERRDFASAMLADVLDALRNAGRDPVVRATTAIDVDAPVVVDDRPLTEAVNAVLAAAERPVAVVMADVPLATPDAIERLLAASGDVVLAPGRGGGTNAMVVRERGFRADYHGASVRDHRQIAADLDATVATVDSFRLATDVDEPADLVEVLLHGSGAARTWLEDHGFELAITEGRVDIRRE